MLVGLAGSLGLQDSDKGHDLAPSQRRIPSLLSLPNWVGLVQEQVEENLCAHCLCLSGIHSFIPWFIPPHFLFPSLALLPLPHLSLSSLFNIYNISLLVCACVWAPVCHTVHVEVR